MSHDLIIPSFDNVNRYITSVMKIPNLTEEREQELANRLREDDDTDAAKEIINAHLKLVVSISRSYDGYGLPQEDIIQEGNIGLMLAVKKYDPNEGVRVSSYAIPHIKYQIQHYVTDNHRIIKIATTKPLRKAFFNFRKLKNQLGTNGKVSNAKIAQELKIKPEEVDEIERRMQFPVLIDHQPEYANDEYYHHNHIQELSHHNGPLTQLLKKEKEEKDEKIKLLIENLDERSRDVITNRFLNDKPETLSTLSKRHGVSMERIRQIETKTLKKIKSLATRH